MSSWKDICRESNGSDVCEDGCKRCIEEAAKRMTDRALEQHKGKNE